MKKALQALSLALTLSLFGGAAIADDGTFKVSDYGDGFDGTSGFCWRGFAFKIGEEVEISSLIMSVGDGFDEGGPSDSGVFQAAVFLADHGLEEEFDVNLTNLVAVAETDQLGEEMVVPLDDTVTLVPDQWYVLAQGRVSGDMNHVRVDNFDADVMLAAGLITDWGLARDDRFFYFDECDMTALELLALNPYTSDTTSTIPALGFVMGEGTPKIDPLFSQDKRFNSLVDACRRDFVETIQGQRAPSLTQYLGCMFTDVNKGNIDKVNAAILAEYKASIAAGKTMTSADIHGRVQLLAQRFAVLDRLIASPSSVYIDDLISIGLTDLKSAASRYRAISAIRSLADSIKGDYAALEREIAQLVK